MATPEQPVERRRRRRFDDLYRPIRVLTFLVIIAAVFQIYKDMQDLVNKVLGVLLLFLFAAIIAMLLTPVVDWLETRGRLHGRRGLAVLVLNTGLILIVAFIAALLFPSVAGQGASFANTFPKLASDIQANTNGFFQELNNRGIPIQSSLPTNAGALIAPVLGSAVQIITGAIGAVVNLLLVVVISIYFQTSGRDILASLRRVFPKYEKQFDFTVVAAGSTLVSYVRAQVIFATIMALYTGIVLSLIGVHYAVVIALITFFLELVPLLGSPVAMLLAIAIALLQGPLVTGLTALATVGGHLLVAYTVGLRLYGRSAKVHPLVALAALVLGAQLGGVLGAIFAIPIAGLLNVYLGALYRAGSAQGAFELEGTQTDMTAAETLPSLGEQITEPSASRAAAGRERAKPASTASKRA